MRPVVLRPRKARYIGLLNITYSMFHAFIFTYTQGTDEGTNYDGSGVKAKKTQARP